MKRTDYLATYGVRRRFVEAFFRMTLKTFREWRERGLLVLFRRQRPDEKKKAMSVGPNGVGFSRYDAPRLTAVAEKIIRGVPLTAADDKLLQQRIPRYWEQLFAASDPQRLREHLVRYYGVPAQGRLPFDGTKNKCPK